MSICFNLPSGYRAAVVGATGGIGSAFVELIRRDERCSDLISLGRSLENKLDITDERSIALSVKAVAERGSVHLIVIATGILLARRPPKKKPTDCNRPGSKVMATA